MFTSILAALLIYDLATSSELPETIDILKDS